MRRLYCDSSGAFVVAASLAEARQTHPLARVARDPDVAEFWRQQRLEAVPTRQIIKALGVSRQTVSNWRARAGAFVPLEQRNVPLIVGSLLRSGASVRQVAATVKRHPATVRRIARKLGVRPVVEQRKISADELAELAAGRTWTQLSEAVGRSISTLRTRVYSDPPLARRLRAVMVRDGGSRAKQV